VAFDVLAEDCCLCFSPEADELMLLDAAFVLLLLL